MSDSQNLFLDPANPLGLRYVISGLLPGNFSVKLEDLFGIYYFPILCNHYRSGKYEGKSCWRELFLICLHNRENQRNFVFITDFSEKIFCSHTKVVIAYFFTKLLFHNQYYEAFI